MEDVLNLPVEKMTGLSFNCECGRFHSFGVKKIYIGQNSGEALLDAILNIKPEKILIIADNNTWAAEGKNIFEFLSDNKFKVKSFVFNQESTLIPDERAAGSILIEAEKDVSLIITAGSGTLNDLSRFISFKLNIPYIILCTAPSMDGYASMVSSLIVRGYKKTFGAVYPYAVIADEDVICGAPIEMLRAGFGDMIGKFTALSDWELSNKVNGEHICHTCESLMKKAAEETASDAELIGSRNKDAVKKLFNSLILSGISMGLVGNSRPASGSEHHLSHYWEMKAITEGAPHPLHGNAVGVGTIVISAIYERLKDELEISSFSPGTEYISDLLKKANLIYNPAELGISRDVFHESIIHAMEIRPRYTILSYLSQKGNLKEMADSLTQEFYDKI